MTPHPWWWYVALAVLCVPALWIVSALLDGALRFQDKPPSYGAGLLILLALLAAFVVVLCGCAPEARAEWRPGWTHGPTMRWTLARPDSSTAIYRSAKNALTITVRRGTVFLQVRWHMSAAQDSNMFVVSPIMASLGQRLIVPVDSALPYFSFKAWSPDSGVVEIDPVQADR